MVLRVEVGTGAGPLGPGLIPGAQSPQGSVIWPFPSLAGAEITEFIYSCGLCAPVLLECGVSMETHRDALDLCAQATDGIRGYVLWGAELSQRERCELR